MPGPVPPVLGQLGALQFLLLASNQLTGPIPAGEMGALTHLHLAANQLSGPIPPELGQLEVLTHLDLFTNPQLTGKEAFRGHMQAHRPACEFSL